MSRVCNNLICEIRFINRKLLVIGWLSQNLGTARSNYKTTCTILKCSQWQVSFVNWKSDLCSTFLSVVSETRSFLAGVCHGIVLHTKWNVQSMVLFILITEHAIGFAVANNYKKSVYQIQNCASRDLSCHSISLHIQLILQTGVNFISLTMINIVSLHYATKSMVKDVFFGNMWCQVLRCFYLTMHHVIVLSTCSSETDSNTRKRNHGHTTCTVFGLYFWVKWRMNL